MTLLEKDYTPTHERVPAEAQALWLFESPLERAALSAHFGIPVYAAYKPLLHAVLEQGLLLGVAKAEILYPVVPGDDPDRFLLEAYPLHDLVAAEVTFTPVETTDPRYLIRRDDGVEHRIFAPTRWRDVAGSPRLATCGWVETPTGGHRLLTPHEEIYDDTCTLLDNLPLNGPGPYFERLEIIATVPGEDQRLSVGDEQVSIAEALHEDIYFSALEIFAHRLDLPDGSRSLTPGQIVPRIFYGEPSLTVRKAPGRAAPDPTGGDAPVLTRARHWLSPGQINAHLEQIGGTPVTATSRQGRPVSGRVVNSNAPMRLALTAGQHANESSPIVGALRAGHALAEAGVGFTIAPLVNPDGYALFRALCADHPRHMHHAARYTAGGNDIQFGTGHESEILPQARALNSAEVHLNLHGYPSHEWTRPFSGYIPKGFARWALPKGFFLILHHWPGYEALAERVLTAAVDAVSGHEAQMAQNWEMLNRYRRFFPKPDFEILQGAVPVDRNIREDDPFPVTLITEAPDETITGEDFRIAHETHYRVVMAVSQALSSQSPLV